MATPRQPPSTLSTQGTPPNTDTQSHRSGGLPAKSNTEPATEGSGPAFTDTTTQIGADVTAPDCQTTAGKPAKRKKNRHRKRRNRRHSFIATEDPPFGPPPAVPAPDATTVSNLAGDRPKPEVAQPFYKLRRDPSSTSLESEALLDHRYAQVLLLLYLYWS